LIKMNSKMFKALTSTSQRTVNGYVSLLLVVS
jgi:hypothetical protein